MKHIIGIFIGILSFIIPLVSFSSDFQQQQNPLYPFKSSIFLQEEFLGGSTASNSIGALGWSAANGTVGNLAGETNRYGIIRRDTSAVLGTIATLAINSGAGAATDPTVNHSIMFASRLNTNDANTTVRIGALNSPSISPPANGIFFEKLDADTNWFCVTRSGGVQTRTNSGIAVNTSFNNFSYTRNSSGVLFSINNTVVCTNTTNITTTFLNPSLHIVTSAAAAKTIDTDYAQIIFTGLTR